MMNNNLSGVMLVDKPEGLTSFDVVAKIRKKLKIKAVGHAGTLDPLAEGLLLILLGKATKLSRYLMATNKSYDYKIKLGVETDSFDKDGKITKESKVKVTEASVMETLDSLEGSFQWEVPIFSAAKVNGKKLYEYARSETPVQLPVKEMEFKHVFLDKYDSSENDHYVHGSLECTKGSFVRSFAQKFGEKLECGAALWGLTRTTVGHYELADATKLDDILNFEDSAENPIFEADFMKKSFVPLEELLPLSPCVRICGLDKKLLTNGTVSHDLQRRLILNLREAQQKNEEIPIKVLNEDTGDLISLLSAQPQGGIKVVKVFSSL